jgi:GTP-binding protein
MMLPAIALVGRPNVGKSTLFNRLTGTRDALVADYPGLTRDRLYGFLRSDFGAAIVIDTGGLGGDEDELAALMARQVELAVAEADVVVLLLEAAAGLTPGDERIAELLRRSGKPVVLAVNKAEGLPPDATAAEFWSLGMDEPQVISAERGDRVQALLERVLERCPVAPAAGPVPRRHEGLHIAAVGRPNVGKSTLINRFLGEERLVTQDQAGTTRDSIYVPFVADGQPYVLIDTAGIRRRAKVTEVVEKFSIVQSLKAIDAADAVMILCDARAGITEQDVSLVGLVLERGRALTLAINKWDGLSAAQKSALQSELERRLPFLDFVDVHYISALHGSKIQELLASAAQAAQCAGVELPARRLTEVVTAAVSAHPPPVVRGRCVKLNYAHQGGRRPPVVVVHGNQTERLALSYRRYLINEVRKAFRLRGTPIRLQLVTGSNPFAGKRNTLTPRQQRRRKRVRSQVRR